MFLNVNYITYLCIFINLKNQKIMGAVKEYYLHGMKKGIQYSHYCGTELTELCCGIWLTKDDLKNNDIKSAMANLDDLQLLVTCLTERIAELDKINKMKF